MLLHSRLFSLLLLHNCLLHLHIIIPRPLPPLPNNLPHIHIILQIVLLLRLLLRLFLILIN